MALPPFKQSQLGTLLLGVSIFFVVLFPIALPMNWISNRDMFRPVFGGQPTAIKGTIIYDE